MSAFHNRSLAFCSLPILMFLSGCNAGPECDTPETRNAVLQAVRDDHRNALLDFAARNETAPASSRDATPTYLLGEKMVTVSKDKDGKTLQCSGAISASVGDIKASKEIEFTVQRSSDGKLSVSVVPFQFNGSAPPG